jgi:hypothetical protein
LHLKKLFFGFCFWFCANKVVLLCLEKRERFGRWEMEGLLKYHLFARFALFLQQFTGIYYITFSSIRGRKTLSPQNGLARLFRGGIAFFTNKGLAIQWRLVILPPIVFWVIPYF